MTMCSDYCNVGSGSWRKLLKREYLPRALWNDFFFKCDVRLNSTGLIINLGAQWRGEVIQGIGLI